MTKPNDPAVVAAKGVWDLFVDPHKNGNEQWILRIIREAHKPLYDELAAAKAEIKRLGKLVDRYGAERVKLCEEGKLDNGPTQEGASDG